MSLELTSPSQQLCAHLSRQHDMCGLRSLTQGCYVDRVSCCSQRSAGNVLLYAASMKTAEMSAT